MIVAGFGFREGTPAASLRSALDLAADGRDVAALATPVDKAAEQGFIDLAAALVAPVIEVSPNMLAAAQTLTRSDKVVAARGVGSVAEAAAIAAAGPGGRLLGPRRISSDRRAACALAVGGEA